MIAGKSSQVVHVPKGQLSASAQKQRDQKLGNEARCKEAHIQRCVSKVKEDAESVILFAAEYGVWLLERKKEMGHGNFLRWLEDCTDTSEDKAERYMFLGKRLLGPNSAHVRNLLKDAKSFNQAVRAVRITEEPNAKKRAGKAPDAVSKANKLAAMLARELVSIERWDDSEEFKRLRHGLEAIAESYKRLLFKPDALAKDDVETHAPEQEHALEPIDITATVEAKQENVQH